MGIRHHGDMGKDIESLFDFICDIERRLWGRLDALKEDMWSDDGAVRRAAETKAAEHLSWLLPPPTPIEAAKSREDAICRMLTQFEEDGYPLAGSRRLAESYVRSLRGRGRPKQRGPEALRALSLHLRTDKKWRDITLEISGPCKERHCHSYCPCCEDVQRSVEPGRPAKAAGLHSRCPRCKFPIRSAEDKQPICFRCIDRVQKLANEAKAYLIREGIDLPNKK